MLPAGDISIYPNASGKRKCEYLYYLINNVDFLIQCYQNTIRQHTSIRFFIKGGRRSARFEKNTDHTIIGLNKILKIYNFDCK